MNPWMYEELMGCCFFVCVFFPQKYKGSTVEKRLSFQQIVLKELNMHMHRNGLLLIACTVYRNWLKMNHRLKFKPKSINILEKIQDKILDQADISQIRQQKHDP